MVAWHLITGEYPPQPGGVSDYNAVLAEGLAKEGVPVHVWGPPTDGITPELDGVTVHRIAGKWSASDFARLNEALSSFPLPRKLLVQYVPNAWGRRGLNFGFCRWILSRRQAGDDVRLMVHEPFYPWRLWDKPSRWFLAAGHRWMIRTLLSASSEAYLAIPAWEKRLRAYESGKRREMTWLPIPSTIPVVSDPNSVAERRHKLAREGQMILGSFGTFGGKIRKMLARILPPLLLSDPMRVGLLLGRGSEGLANEIVRAHPSLTDRLVAFSDLLPEQLSVSLQTCDLLVQPYPDGVSSRRTSVMAGLAHGLPIVTTEGFLSERLWAKTDCVVLASPSDNDSLIQAVELLLSDPGRRAILGEKALATYTKTFGVEHTVKELLRDYNSVADFGAPLGSGSHSGEYACH